MNKMKFKVTMKDPDTLYDAISDAVERDLLKKDGLDEDDRETLSISRRNKIISLCGRWFKYGEYLTVEIDTDAKTIMICPASEK
jgi:hypothetical protein